MLDEFLSWWAARWREVLPESWFRGRADRLPVLVLRPDRLDRPGTIGVGLRQRGGLMPLGALAAGAHDRAPPAEQARALAALLGNRPLPRRTVLEVPQGVVLTREVTLPAAAEADLDRVLGYEMDRLTPFPAADILHAHAVRRRDRAANRLTLSLSLVPLARVAPALEALGRAGLAAQAIEGVDGAGARRRIPLGGRGRRRGDALRHGAWALALGLLAIAAIAPFARQGAALAAADARIAALRPRVAEAERFRARILASAASAGVFADAANRIADPLSVLATVTRSLPDDTYLTDFSLNGLTITLNGQSKSAAKLIGLLAADPTVDNPAFSAPVTRLEATHTDLFSIRAEVVPAAALGAVPPPAAAASR